MKETAKTPEAAEGGEDAERVEGPDPSTLEAAAAGNVKALVKLAFFCRETDLRCSIRLFARGLDVLLALRKWDESLVPLPQLEEVYLFYILTDVSIKHGKLVHELRQYVDHPWENLARSAVGALEQLERPPLTLVERIEDWWRRPWGNKWLTEPIPSVEALESADEYIPVLRLDDPRPWRGSYYLLVSKTLKRSGIPFHEVVRLTPLDRAVELNESEQRAIDKMLRDRAGMIFNHAHNLYTYGLLRSGSWSPFAEGWQILKETEELIEDPAALSKANPLPNASPEEQSHEEDAQ